MRLYFDFLLLPLLPPQTSAQAYDSKTLEQCKTLCSQNNLCELAIFFASNRTCSQFPCASTTNPRLSNADNSWLKPDYESRCPSEKPSNQNECIENCLLDENCEATTFLEEECKDYDCKGSYFDAGNATQTKELWYKPGREQRCLGSTSGGVYPSGQVLDGSATATTMPPAATSTVAAGEAGKLVIGSLGLVMLTWAAVELI